MTVSRAKLFVEAHPRTFVSKTSSFRDQRLRTVAPHFSAYRRYCRWRIPGIELRSHSTARRMRLCKLRDLRLSLQSPPNAVRPTYKALSVLLSEMLGRERKG